MKNRKTSAAPSTVTGLLALGLMMGLPISMPHKASAQSEEPSPPAEAPASSPEEQKKQLEAVEGKKNLPGHKETMRTKILSAGAEVLQKFDPINEIHVTVCGLHFYSDAPERQVVAHHFCSHLNNDILQCVIYDTNKTNARLIGVEYIISEEVFKTLPEDEKRFWHSHRYEVKSGQLVALRIPEAVENALMKDLQTTYGKTWHFWQVDRGDELPLGIPQLMMGFTQDGQANPDLVAKRDKEYGINSEKIRKDRASFPEPPILPGANAWEKGTTTQLKEIQVPMPPFPAWP